MKKKKKNYVRLIIFLVILFIPLFFRNPHRAEQLWYEIIIEPAGRLLAVILGGAIGGFILAGLIYLGGCFHSWYVGMIENNMEKSMEYDKKWNFESVYGFIFDGCFNFMLIALYVLTLIYWMI